MEWETFNLLSIYYESTCSNPLIFILSPGSDPLSDIQKLGESVGKAD